MHARFKSFNSIARMMSIHYQVILNYFDKEIQMHLQNLLMPELKLLEHSL